MFGHLFEHLARLGFQPALIFDIGAYEGEFVDVCRARFPKAAIWAFEANMAKQALLGAKADRVFTEVLNDVAGSTDYWETEAPVQTGNSIFRENTNVPFRKTQRSCIDLDSLVPDCVPQLAKLDTQGSELAILRGGLRTICRADVLIVESNIRRYNLGAPLFGELFAFLDAQNFRLIDLFETVRAQGTLVQADVVFMNRRSPHYFENMSLNVSAP